jgi:microsomal dipeptidase-like Zn-dependent dipeptidase/gamma-glutamyl-gamma-aminobutyrate hydrolase PuuD
MEETWAKPWAYSYNASQRNFPASEHRPVIGITGNFGAKGCEVSEGYFASIVEAGGVPLIIPPYLQNDALLETLSRIDGLLLSGGGDLNPLLMDEDPIRELHSVNPKRDEAELTLIRWAYDRQIPMLGICRGIQMITFALDGTLYQDIYAQAPKGDVPFLKHDQEMDVRYPSHRVSVAEKSLLHEIFKQDSLEVNSIHHQAVCHPGSRLRAVAHSADGVIEAVESTEFKAILGVQWHPETFFLRGDKTMMPIFNWLVGEANVYRRASDIHQRAVTIDSHCDTPMFFDQGVDFYVRDPKILVDLHKMDEGKWGATTMVAYIPQGERDEAGLEAATQYANKQFDRLEQKISECHGYLVQARNFMDVLKAKEEGRKCILFGLENGYAFGKDVANVQRFAHRGVVYATLCHNGDNDVCDSARGNNEHDGVSAFGEEIIHAMNRVGMLVDLSHASEKSFYDAIEISEHPVFCSHSSCRALCDHPRNLTDDQMRTLANTGGIQQITLYSGFLRKVGEADINDAMEHLQHAIDIMGADKVGLGTDFDGDGGIRGLANASELLQFTRQMLKRRYPEDVITGILGGNYLNFLRSEYLRVHPQGVM